MIAPWSVVGAQDAICRQPGDSSQSQLESITKVMRASDTSSTFMRNEVGLAGLDTADMVLVTDDSVCAQVDSALMANFKNSTMTRWVVYRLGTNRFAAFYPGWEHTSIFFVDDQRKVLVILL